MEEHESIEMKQTSTNTIPFNSLSPISDYERYKEYCDALEWALSNRKEKDIKNIALTGTYGSGKSSILKTLKDKNCKNQDLHFLKISLATFKEESKNKQDNDYWFLQSNSKVEIPYSKNEQLRLIELSILQQIFYHEKYDKIPESRFKKIRILKTTEIIRSTWLLFGVIITFCGFFYFEVLREFLIIPEPKLWFRYVFHGLFLFSFLTLLYFFLKKFIYFSHKLTVSKFNFQNIEIEVKENSGKSILNSHLDEILYFFEATDYNVVIIEDLDRFEQTEIFTKLREINLLLNNSEAIKREIVFIYAVRDEMFKDSDRTKFFDFIIPVIPVINYSNSKELLAQSLNQFRYVINSELIKDVAFYVDDMRLLYNIVNEFHIYFQKFKRKEYVDKLFAIIFYKNIYPEDFVQLGKNKGVLHDFLKVKTGEWVKEKTLIIDKEISELKISVDQVSNVYPKTIRELRSIYLLEYLKHLVDLQGFKVEGANKTIDQMLEDENFAAFINDSAEYRSRQGGYQKISIKFSNIEKNIDTKLTYKDKKELIDKRNNNEISLIRQKIKKLELEKKSVRTAKIKELLTEELIKNNNKKTKQNQIILLLLRNGYIAEDYLAYISYFYPGSLTEADHWFLMNIKNDLENDFDYELYNIQNLIEEINVFNFTKVSVLNYDIVDFFLQTNLFEDKRGMLITQLANESQTSIDFINGFIENGKYLEKFIEVLCGKWEGIWEYIEVDNSIEEERRIEYLKLIIDYAKVEDIKKMKDESNLKSFIADKKDFLSLISNEVKLKRVISVLEIEFKQLEFKGISNDLKEFIYKNNHYAINFDMLALMLEFNGKLKKNQFNTANYTAIHQSECKKLISNVEDKIQLYISHVYLKIDSIKKEKEEYLLKLLNNENIDVETKKKIIKRSETKISNIQSIKEQKYIVDYLLMISKIEITWKNIINYYLKQEKEFNEILIEFLNNKKHCEILSKSKVSIQKEKSSEFIRKFCLTEEIENELYGDYIDSFTIYFKELPFENLSPEKISILINRKKLYFNKYHYDLLRQHFENLHINFIEDNKIEFLNLFEEITLNAKDIAYLLDSERLNFNDKKVIIERTSEIFFISDSKVLGLIGELTLKKPSFTNRESILKGVLLNSSLNKEKKISFFNTKNSLSLFDKDFITSFLNNLGGKYNNITKKGPQPSFEKTTYNLDLFKYLKSINYISNSIEKLKKIKVTTFRS